ncbi:unnamed protein product [Blepharisma stoltei]|uniref:Anaphase-promoting complex subunit 5 n=1 Tax=Blepharisma stoltei TaxID=1481888 RepID=A0AAU9JPL0_9CILI|nr:unnamed protein product [Blepharisma stoltei]
MDILEQHQELSPYHISLCILLHESFMNPKLLPQQRQKTLSFLVSKIKDEGSEEMSFQDLVNYLQTLEEGINSIQPIKTHFLNAISSLQHFSDILTFFIAKLNELKNEGEMSMGYLEQGGTLYLFLRKCFLIFARMGFEDITKLDKKLQEYKSGKTQEKSDAQHSVSVATNLDSLVLKKTYQELSEEISKINPPTNFICQGHLDAYYKNNQAIDNIHRYFDMILDSKMPTKTTREKGLVVVQSSTHYASLHRVKIELQLGHLEPALHLLVETIKRALSENDNPVILESTLLFMKIAGLMGNYKKEKRIAERAVLQSIKLGNLIALIKSSLFFSQADLLYSKCESSNILAEIKPKIDTKKKIPMIVPRYLNVDTNVKTWVNLADYAFIEGLVKHEHADLRSNQMRMNVLNWMNQGCYWISHSFLNAIKENPLKTAIDADFYLQIARFLAQYQKDTVLDILKYVDSYCSIKTCIKWDFSIYYIGHIWSLNKGELLEALYFEEKAIETLNQTNDVDLFLDIKLNKLRRLIHHYQLREAYELANELISTLHDRGSKVRIVETRILLSYIYSMSSQHYKALSEINKTLPYIEDFSILEIIIKTRLAEVYLDIAPNSIPSLQILTPLDKILDRVNFPLICGKYHAVKAKCLFALGMSLNSNLSMNLMKSGIDHCIKAVDYFKQINSCYEIREVLYMQARGFHQIGDFGNRDKSAEEFCKINQEINWAAKRTKSRESQSLVFLIGD